MKNKFLNIVSTFCLVLLIGVIFTSCDLSHKHYFDNYGVCKSCQKDSCITITKDPNSNTYSLPYYVNINTRDDGFFKFVSNGENGILITFTKDESSSNGEPSFKQIRFYSEESALITSNVEKQTLSYNNTLKAGVTYYIWLDIENYACNIKLTVSESN